MKVDTDDVLLTVRQPVLAEATSWVARYVARRPTVPILAGILVRTNSGDLVVECFDHHVSASAVVDGEVSAAGRVLVPGRMFADIVRALPDDEVELEANGEHLFVRCDGLEFRLNLLPVEEFPVVPRGRADLASCDAAAFGQALGRVSIAAGRDDLLPIFTTVRLEVNPGEIVISATDRYRVALDQLSARTQDDRLPRTLLVPSTVLADAAKAMAAGDQITIGLDPDPEIFWLRSEQAGITREITARLIDGRYPRLESTMNLSGGLTLRVRREVLVGLVGRLRLVAGIHPSVIFEEREEGLVLEVATPDLATARGVLPYVRIERQGDPDQQIRCAFNPQYLLDALVGITADLVDLHLFPERTTCLVRPAPSEDVASSDPYVHVMKLKRVDLQVT